MRPGRVPHLIPCIAAAVLIFFFTSTSASQAVPAKPAADPFAEIQKKYPGLVPELTHLLDRFKQEVQFPPAREQSDLLPRLPEATNFYAALPNYGEPAHQILTIFREELKQNAALRSVWQQGGMASAGPQIESSIEKFYGLSQYLGDEWVIAGRVEASSPNILFFAEVRKPGLKTYLDQMSNGLPLHSTDLHIFTPQELASASVSSRPGQLVVLVRPDFVVASSDLRTVSNLNKVLDAKAGAFANSAFGQRVVEGYRGGVTAIGAADLHKIISQIPPSKKDDQKELENSGFKDVKYLVWSHKNVGGTPVGEMELSFIGPRHGAAAWLAPPAPVGSLNFVSPKSVFVGSFLFRNLAVVFDDIQALSASNPQAFGALPQMEQAMHFSLRDDVLSHLDGEITLAIDDLSAPQPQWRAILRVNDADRLEKTLQKLLQSTPLLSRQTEEDGITYHSLMIPSAPKPKEISFAFVDGYLLFASSHEAAVDAIARHKSGESLANSSTFLASLPPGYPREVSAMVYQNTSTLNAFRMQQVSPEIAEALSHLNGGPSPTVFCAYGEANAIRLVSSGRGADTTGILIGAAIAIPNLLRARTTANESSALATLRTINTAEIAYSATYLRNGYARDLATLGPDPRGSELHTMNHAALIDAELGNPRCTAGAWCEKSGYRFTVTATCLLRSCSEFVAIATPASGNTGSRNFCSTSDAVIHVQAGMPLSSPISAAECKLWMPMDAGTQKTPEAARKRRAAPIENQQDEQ